MSFLDVFKKTTLAWELRRIRKLLFHRSRSERAEWNFYSAIVPRGAGHIVDIGASHGYKSEIFRRLADAVVAVEPDPSSAEVLRQRFAWRRNVRIREHAVSSRPGNIKFYRFGPGSPYNTADVEWADALEKGENQFGLQLPVSEVLEVQALPLRLVISECAIVKYLKVDVEGHEPEVMATLDRAIPLISLEFNISESLAGLNFCVAQIERLGEYEFNAVISEPPIKLEFQWCSGADLIELITSRGWKYVEVYARLCPDEC